MMPLIDIFRSLLSTCFPGPQVLSGKPPVEKEDVDAVQRQWYHDLLLPPLGVKA